MLKKLLLAACLGLTLGACNDEEPDTGLPNNYVWAESNPCIVEGKMHGKNMHFYGRTRVTDAQGGEYVDPTAYFEFAGGAEQLSLYMHKTRFAEAMPPLEMRLAHLPYTGSDNGIALAVERVIPDYNVPGLGYQPAERYTITDLEVSVSGIDCRVEFTCAGVFDVLFEGRQIVER